MFSLNKLSSKLPYLCRPQCNRTLTLSPSNWSSIKKASESSVAPTKGVSGNPVKFTTSEANLGYKATLNFSGDDRDLPSSHNLVLATSVIASIIYLILLRDDPDADGGFKNLTPVHELIPEMAIPLLQSSIAENKRFGRDTSKLEKKLAEYLKKPEKYGGNKPKLVEN